MVDPVVEAGVADTLEARLADAQKRIENGEYGKIPLAIVEFGIRAQWATEHPSCPASPRPIRNDDGVDDEVDGGARVSGNDGTKQRGVIKFDGGIDRSQARVQRSTAAPGSSRADLEIAGLKGFADGTVPIPPKENVVLRRELSAAHLLTFMVILRFCLPVVQLVLRSCRERLDAGHQAWHFILSTYQVKDDLYIGQLEEKMTHIRMGEQESATDYCNRARRILAEMQMAGAEYSMATYITHVLKGLPHSYNLVKRMTMVPGTCESLDVDSLTSYILQDEAMQEADKPTELLLQASDVAPMKQSHQQEQRGKLSGGGSGGGRSTKDVDEKKSTRSKGREGGGRRRECWICYDPDLLSLSDCRVWHPGAVGDGAPFLSSFSSTDTKRRWRRRRGRRWCTSQRQRWHEAERGDQLEIAGLKGFADGTVPIPPKENVVLRRELSAAHLLTFMVILRFCLPVVQLVLRSCRERLDAGHQAWHFILSTYQVKDDLYIGQLEEKMTHIRMGEQESATDYCNRARRILAEMRMAGAEYSMATYITHVLKGLPHSYNLVKRMTMVPGTCESLDVDSLTSYILQDEAMQEADKPTELLLQASDVAPMKQSHQQEQRGKLSGGGSGGGRSTKDVDEKKSTRSKGREGGGRRRECWICYDPDLLSYEWAMLTPVRWR
ncbi:unnamed protein product [Closterium sp. NIES-54]